MNSFVSARFQRKLNKFAENPLSGCLVLVPTFRVTGLGSRVPSMSCVLSLRSRRPNFRIPGFEKRVPPMGWVPGHGFRAPSKVPGLGSHFSDMLLQSVFHLKSFTELS